MKQYEHPDIARIQALGDDVWGERTEVDDCDVCHKPIHIGEWHYRLEIAGELRLAHEDCVTYTQMEDES